MSIRFIEKLKRIVFPRGLTCASCGREAVVNEEGLCTDCAEGIERFVTAPQIDYVDGFTAAYIYNDVSGSMIKKLKYSGERYLARTLADSLTIPDGWEYDVVVPVPLHYKRIAKRGFNQSELIAKHICEKTGKKLDVSLIVRRIDTKQQARMSAAGRRRNLKNAFLADEKCKGMSVLLIDDVRTTGSTLSECAKTLKQNGCARVYAAACCFAKPDEHGIK